MSFFDDFEELFKKFKRGSGVSTGYSISVVYGPDGKPIVNVETYGNIDKNALRREIERLYPGAKIRGLEEEPIIKEENEEEKRREVREDRKFKPIIWEEDDEE